MAISGYGSPLFPGLRLWKGRWKLFFFFFSPSLRREEKKEDSEEAHEFSRTSPFANADLKKRGGCFKTGASFLPFG